MSNVYAGERTVPTLLLIVFIVGILVCGVAAYVIHTERARLENERDSGKEKLGKRQAGLADNLRKRDEILKAVGVASVRQIEDIFKSSLVKLPEPEKKLQLATLVSEQVKKRNALIKSIGVEPKTPEAAAASEFLELTITNARRAGVVPDNLKDARAGELIDQHLRLDKASAACADVVTQGEKALADVDASIEAKKTETRTKFKDLDDQAAKAFVERVAEDNKLRDEKPGWDSELATLTQRRNEEKSINVKLEGLLKNQDDMVTPLDGVILSYDWRARRGTVNLGARERVKAGYLFDVYTRLPGDDTVRNRLYRGKIRLLNVGVESALFAVIPSDWESEKTPIMEGQRVSSQIYDNVRRRSFCLKGWFPEGGDHSKEALAGMIYRAGGIVHDDLALDTDYLVVGVTSEEGLTSLSPQAKAVIADGAKAREDARHFYVTVLTVEKLFKYWDNAGTLVSD